MDAFLKGDGNDWLKVVAARDPPDGFLHRSGLADGTEIGPGTSNIPGSKKELAGFPGRFDYGFLILLVVDLLALDKWKAQFVPLLHQARFEDQAIFAGFEITGSQIIQ